MNATLSQRVLWEGLQLPGLVCLHCHLSQWAVADLKSAPLFYFPSKHWHFLVWTKYKEHYVRVKERTPQLAILGEPSRNRGELKEFQTWRAVWWWIIGEDLLSNGRSTFQCTLVIRGHIHAHTATYKYLCSFAKNFQNRKACTHTGTVFSNTSHVVFALETPLSLSGWRVTSLAFTEEPGEDGPGGKQPQPTNQQEQPHGTTTPEWLSQD